MLKQVFDRFDTAYEYRFPRPMIEYIKDNNKKDGLVGVEIGTQRGVNAYNILSLLPVKELYLVDPYSFYSYNGQSSGAVDPDSIQRRYLLQARQRLKKFKDRVRFIYYKSENAVRFIPDDLDFVYIDGNHDYSFVRKDIWLYWKKIRKGGILGGHDINHSDVFKAVSEFRQHEDKYIFVRRKDWWFVK